MHRNLLILLVATLLFWMAPGEAAFAQEKAVRYAGELHGGRSGCPLNGSSIQVNVKGEEITGTWTTTKGGKAKFQGTMKGTTFRIIHQAKDGDQPTINGSVNGDTVEVKFEGSKCTYKGVLKKA